MPGPLDEYYTQSNDHAWCLYIVRTVGKTVIAVREAARCLEYVCCECCIVQFEKKKKKCDGTRFRHRSPSSPSSCASSARRSNPYHFPSRVADEPQLSHFGQLRQWRRHDENAG